MRFKNLEEVKGFSLDSIVPSETEAEIQRVTENAKKREKERQYTRLASAVLLRVNIHPETKDLSAWLGDCSERTNVVAVKDWILELAPYLENFGRDEIEYFASELRDVLRDIEQGDY